jgi:hypothetical protein
MNYLMFYLGSCLGVYVAAWFYNEHRLPKPSIADLTRGVVGALFWPVTLTIIWITEP